MAKWKDRYIYTVTPPNLKGSEITLGKFRLSIHRHIAYPKDMWFASCQLFSLYKLKSKDILEAKAQAKAHLQCILQDAIDEIVNVRLNT